MVKRVYIYFLGQNYIGYVDIPDTSTHVNIAIKFYKSQGFECNKIRNIFLIFKIVSILQSNQN